MPKHFNKPSEKSKRRQLRRDQTSAEKVVWHFLRDRRTKNCKFRRQYSVDKFVIDFYSPELKLAVEIDGDVHDLPAQKEHDVLRQKYLESFGIKFIRITNEEVFLNIDKAFDRIEEMIKFLDQS